MSIGICGTRFPPLPLPRGRAIAFFAYSMRDPIMTRWAIQILTRIWVPLWAMRDYRSAPLDIFQWRDGLQVFGIHTATHAAEMIYLISVRNLASENLMRYAMGPYCSPASFEFCVAIWIYAANPQPTPRGRLRQRKRHESIQ